MNGRTSHLAVLCVSKVQVPHKDRNSVSYFIGHTNKIIYPQSCNTRCPTHSVTAASILRGTP
jgi:hypothetical protein